jgi:acyl phosphate:glycerol-3-phosphate acyltransferase
MAEAGWIEGSITGGMDILLTILPGFLDGQALLTSVGWFLGAYLLGSIQVAWLIARWVAHKDLRSTGSGNVGVMNTAISVARWAGIVVFISEVAKGVLAVMVPNRVHAGDPVLMLTILGIVTGTRWPVWIGFKGGRGNTAGFSAILLISFYTPLISLAIWILAYMFFKGSFKATRVTICALPVILWFTTHSWWFVLTGVILSLLYLQAQKRESDDHLIIKQQYSSLWKFLSSPRRG